MKYFFDTEFIEDGKTIDLISIGIISEDGRSRYYESSECDLEKASLWVKENVIPHLQGGFARIPRKEIAKALVQFVDGTPEFWAYYCSYDWIALCQLYGTIMDLPPTWPMWCHDIMQLWEQHGCPDLPKQNTTEHCAIDDAVWNKKAWEFLNALGK
jgi:hypothetical protein